MLWNRISERRPARVRGVLPWALCTLAAVFVAVAGWIRFRFGRVSFEQIITNLPISGGEGVGNNSLLIEVLLACLVVPVTLTTLGAGGLWLLRRRRERRPRTVRRTLVVPALAMAVALGVLLTVAGVPQFAVAMLDARTIADYYQRPTVTSAPAHPRNLITIYLESTENTFADESVFGENLLENLQDATAGWADYPLQQYPTGGWTMAGIVGTQCAIPLKSKLLVAGTNSNTLGEQVERYLPGTTCLGDVLAAQGYTNAFLGGAHTRFAGKDTFLFDHGYTSVQGLADWEADGEDREDISVWGLSDTRLFARATAELTELREAGEPFNLTILTMDTHEPAGVFPSCTTDDEVAMATALKCSGRAVAGFLEDLKDGGYLDDTVVVLMGDHLKDTANGGDFGTLLADRDDRTIFFRVWSPDGVRFLREGADQLSVLATLLELLGFTLPDGQAGLGVSFAGVHDLSWTALALPSDEYRTLMGAPSSAIYQEFWQS
jgi:phosphoglycerol transferase